MGKKKSCSTTGAGAPAMKISGTNAAPPVVAGSSAHAMDLPHVNATTSGGKPRGNPPAAGRSATPASSMARREGEIEKVKGAGQTVESPGQMVESQLLSANQHAVKENPANPVVVNVSSVEKSQNAIANQNSVNGNQDKGIFGSSWASLFKNNRSSASGAALSEVFEGIDREGIHFNADELEDDSQVSRSLIGFFSPKFPGMDAIKQMTDSWIHKCTFFRHASTWTVFTFTSKEEASSVLEAGPYHIFGNVLHLKAMPKFFNFNREAQRDVPVWIQLHNLPLEFWRPRLLSKICTYIGQPLHTDRLTSTRERISFARCLVQVGVGLKLPSILPIHLPDGTILEQPVLYENKPISCTKCKRLGHEESACRDTGGPKLYVMKKPIQKQGRNKVNAANTPTDTWVQVGKTTQEDTIGAQAEDGAEKDRNESENEDSESESEGSEELGEEDDDEHSGEESDDGDPEEEAEDREPPVVAVLKASSPTSTPSSPSPVSSPVPLIHRGDRSPSMGIPPGYEIQVDTHGGRELTPTWPSVQDAASLPRATRSRKKK